VAACDGLTAVIPDFVALFEMVAQPRECVAADPAQQAAPAVCWERKKELKAEGLRAYFENPNFFKTVAPTPMEGAVRVKTETIRP
jgi:hypothetical protein